MYSDKDRVFEVKCQQILEILLKLKDYYDPETLQTDPILTFKLHSKLYLRELARMIVGKGWLEGNTENIKK